MKNRCFLPFQCFFLSWLLLSSLASGGLSLAIQLGRSQVDADPEAIANFRNALESSSDPDTPELPRSVGKCLVVSNQGGGGTEEERDDPQTKTRSPSATFPWPIDLWIESVDDNGFVGLRAASQNLTGSQQLTLENDWWVELIVDPADFQPISWLELVSDPGRSDQGTVSGLLMIDARARFTRADGFKVVEFPQTILLDLAGRFEILPQPPTPESSNLHLTLFEDPDLPDLPYFDDQGQLLGACDPDYEDPDNPCLDCHSPCCVVWSEKDTSSSDPAS